MPQSLSKLPIHIVFSTKHRTPSLNREILPELFRYLGGICNHLKCTAIEVGGWADHVHVLCALSRTTSVSDLVREIKRGSSMWMKTKGFNDFCWQGGYSVFAVNPTSVPKVVAYIQNQEVHHTKSSYKEECRAFYLKFDIEFDERYVWD